MNQKLPPPARILTANMLQVLKDGRPHLQVEIETVVATRFEVSEQELREVLPEPIREKWKKGFTSGFRNLEKWEFAYSSGPNAYRATRIGRKAAKMDLPMITASWARQFKAEDAARRASAKALPEPPEDAFTFTLDRTDGVFPKTKVRVGFMRATPPTDAHLLDDPRNVPVWFGTNRVPQNLNNVASGFSGKSGPTVYHGRCVVNIPEGHRTGEIKPGMLEALDRGTEGLVLRSVTGFAAKDFWVAIKAELAMAGTDDSALLFIHGFNVGFSEAALRTAQLRYDLKMAQAAFYSWPSQNKVRRYDEDLQSASTAVPFLANFIESYAAQVASAGLKLHVLAHSMGNHTLLHALRSITARTASLKLASVTFAAPDVDQADFKDWASQIQHLAALRTLYASERDFALEISGGMRDRPRAGKLPPVTCLAGVDTVDVTQIDLSLLGHGYYAAARPVITDMHQLMHFNASPDKRATLREPRPSPAEKYWVIK